MNTFVLMMSLELLLILLLKVSFGYEIAEDVDDIEECEEGRQEANNYDASVFYRCINKRWVTVRCEPGWIYNPEYAACQADTYEGALRPLLPSTPTYSYGLEDPIPLQPNEGQTIVNDDFYLQDNRDQPNYQNYRDPPYQQNNEDPYNQQNYRDLHYQQNNQDPYNQQNFQDPPYQQNFQDPYNQQNFQDSPYQQNYQDPYNQQNFQDPPYQQSYQDPHNQKNYREPPYQQNYQDPYNQNYQPYYRPITPQPFTPVYSYKSSYCGAPTPCPDGKYFADLCDCRKFYQCDHGGAVHKPCGEGTAFNSLHNVCDYPSNVPLCQQLGQY